MAIKRKGDALAKMLEQPSNFEPELILSELNKKGSIDIVKTAKINKFLRFFGGGYENVFEKIKKLKNNENKANKTNRQTVL
ncbi:MAG: hypothetical protein N2489_09915 [Clostridia bacterium]|nr:hypothetical protein [Clostridia bacterium]